MLYIPDVEGDHMVMHTWHRPDAFAEDLAELETLLASSRVDPPGPSSASSGSPGALAWSPADIRHGIERVPAELTA